MSKTNEDPNQLYEVTFVVEDKYAASHCSLCDLEVGSDKYPRMTINTYFGQAKTFSESMHLMAHKKTEHYCQECYRCLWVEAKHCIKGLPDPDKCFERKSHMPDSPVSFCRLDLPCYIIKGSGLNLFRPFDPSEISRIRAENLKLREKDHDAEELLS